MWLAHRHVSDALYLQGVRQELLEGRGFVLLRALPLQQWGRRRSAVAFYGLGAHLGRALSQNAMGVYCADWEAQRAA